MILLVHSSMDKIQKFLVTAGRKDLAQEYYEKISNYSSYMREVTLKDRQVLVDGQAVLEFKTQEAFLRYASVVLTTIRDTEEQIEKANWVTPQKKFNLNTDTQSWDYSVGGKK